MADDLTPQEPAPAPPPVAPPAGMRDWSQPPAPQPRPMTDPTGGLIPLNNGRALASYYLGLFSIFPVFGLVLGVLALLFGFQGLGRLKERPEIKGGTHAKIGIGCGAFGILLNVALVGTAVLAYLNR